MSGLVDLPAPTAWAGARGRSARASHEVDSDAFLALYESALPQVYGYLHLRCGGDVTVAQDLTQETFVVAVRALRSGRADVTVPWLIGVARNKLLEHARGRARERRRVERAQRFATGEPVPPADEHDGDDTLAALRRLPPLQRAAVVLRYLDDLPVDEVARLLGRSVHATESLLARGRAAMRSAYGATHDA